MAGRLPRGVLNEVGIIGIGALTGRLTLAETLGDHLPKLKQDAPAETYVLSIIVIPT